MRAPVAACLIAAAVGLASVLGAAPAEAKLIRVTKATTNCAPKPSNSSFPTPAPATNVSATPFQAGNGKEKVMWFTAALPLADYGLYFQVLTSNGQCTKPSSLSQGKKDKCLRPYRSTGWTCKIKRLRSGSTEFRVALWYQNSSGAWGPVAYSDWSSAVNVK